MRSFPESSVKLELRLCRSDLRKGFCLSGYRVQEMKEEDGSSATLGKAEPFRKSERQSRQGPGADLSERPPIGSTTPKLNRTVLHAVLALIGFTAMIAQIVLMRELMVVFYGNEISLGLMLANWLLWTAVGSSVLGRLAARARRPRRFMADLQILVSVAFPSAIWLVRVSKSAFQAIPGETLGPGPMFLTSLVTLSLFCLTSGWLFASGSRLYADEVGVSTGAGTSSVYLLEAVGSGAGGFVASLVLIRYLDAFAVAFLLGLLNLLAATSLLVGAGWRRRTAVAALFGALGLLVFPVLVPRLEALSLARLWRGLRLTATRNSIYGNLAVVETEASRSLYENGLVVFTVPDPAAAEEAVHYALLQHPSPKSLLLVGGGVNGSLAQALQHPSLRRVNYVELDPAVVSLARKYFSKDWNPIQADPRVRVHNIDGRLFLKTTSERFDVIALNLPDPQTAQLNRFYTVEFFREVAERLNPDGVFSFQLRAAEDYISPELAAFLRCINNTLRGAFPEVTAIPGETVHFFAATRKGILAADSQDLVSRLRSRGIHTSYVREYYIPFRMSRDRMLDLDQHIRPRADTPVNRDFAPIAYYFNVALWSSRFDARSRRLFEAVSHVSFARIVAYVGLLLLALTGGSAALTLGKAQPFRQPQSKNWGSGSGVRGSGNGAGGGSASRDLLIPSGQVPPDATLPNPESRIPDSGVANQSGRAAKVAACFCIAAMGFTLIGLEILLLLAFQAIYGYVYYQLAILIAAFMVGMALGSWWGLRRSSGQKADSSLHSSRVCGITMTANPQCHPDPAGAGEGSASFRATGAALAEGQDLRTLARLQAVAALCPLALYALLVLLATMKSALGLWVVSQVVFQALAVLCGLLGGYQFPVASRIFFGSPDPSAEGGPSPGALYGLDLLGACLAAVLLSAYVVPVFGFLRTALFMGVVNLAPAGLAGLVAFEYRAPES